MLYPSQIEQKLGFDKVRAKLTKECLSELGKQHVVEMGWMTDFEGIKRALNEVSEFQKLANSNSPVSLSQIFDKRLAIQRSKIAGAYLPAEDLHEINLSLQVVTQAISVVFSTTMDVPHLKEKCNSLEVDHQLIAEISRVLDDNGDLRNNASPELGHYRSSLIEQKQALRQVIDSVLRSSKEQGFTDDEMLPTVRNGRMVIPVKSEYKRKIKGLIHDESDSGQTTYLEPNQVFELNNRIRELEYQEKREVVRILSRITAKVGEVAGELLKAFDLLGELDFIRAKSKLTTALDAVVPHVIDRPNLSWEEVRHPLLILSIGKEATVSQNINLKKGEQVLVISGPNAGGKSVSLKTVGLIQMMFQCGIPVPMKKGSEMGVFKNLLVDIGDEQSLEDELSTYSAHLGNMKFFLDAADENTLMLIDEFGTGTEPEYGGAIAETMLDELAGKGVFGVVTTHYANLKELATQRNGMINGAMLFDPDTMQATYMLEVGRQGNSFALEIAKKMGISDDLMAEAARRVGSRKIDYDQAVKELDNERYQIKKEREVLNEQRFRLEQSKSEYNEIKEHLAERKRKIMDEAKLQAARVIKDANKRVESAIKSIKESKADQKKTHEIREGLKEAHKKLVPEKSKVKEPQYHKIGGEIILGDMVRDTTKNVWGKVVMIKGTSVEIEVGDLVMHKKLKDLERVSKKEIKRSEKSRRTSEFVVNKQANLSMDLDLRGQRVDEALANTEKFLDEAVMVGLSKLRIIHGKGNGVLRSVIRDYIKAYPSKLFYKDEHIERGGDGVTCVELP